VRWGVLAAAKHWGLAMDMARDLVVQEPSAEACLRLARSECRAGDLKEARGRMKTAFTQNEKLRLKAWTSRT
jgi:hypothetical protein